MVTKIKSLTKKENPVLYRHIQKQTGRTLYTLISARDGKHIKQIKEIHQRAFKEYKVKRNTSKQIKHPIFNRLLNI